MAPFFLVCVAFTSPRCFSNFGAPRHQRRTRKQREQSRRSAAEQLRAAAELVCPVARAVQHDDTAALRSASKAMRAKHLLAFFFLLLLACCAICASVLLICAAAFAGYLLQPDCPDRPAARDSLSFDKSLLVRSQERTQYLRALYEASRLNQHHSNISAEQWLCCVQGQRLEPCSRQTARGRLEETSLAREQSPFRSSALCAAELWLIKLTNLRKLQSVCRADARSFAVAGPLVGPWRAARSRPRPERLPRGTNTSPCTDSRPPSSELPRASRIPAAVARRSSAKPCAGPCAEPWSGCAGGRRALVHLVVRLAGAGGAGAGQRVIQRRHLAHYHLLDEHHVVAGGTAA